MQVEKTVFISYRRTNVFTARAVYQNLTANGFDAFLDFENIDSGAFERVILNQIAARAHFIIILTPSALERCNQPGDWLRREIEHAIDLQRNIVPLMFEGFDFGTMSKDMTGKLTVLPQYNGLRVPADFFEEAMDRLRNRFLNKPLEMVLQPASDDELAYVQQQQAAAEKYDAVTPQHLTADEYFERAFNRAETDYEGIITDLSEAIHLNPQFTDAFVVRGQTHSDNGDFDSAIADFTEAARLSPQDADVYFNRGNAYDDLSDFESAIADYSEAIHLGLRAADVYVNRGHAHLMNDDLDSAIADFTEAIHLDPQNSVAYYNRALAHSDKGDPGNVVADCSEAIRIDAEDIDSYVTRAEAYFEMAAYENARNDFRRAFELQPTNSFSLGGLAVSSHALGEVDQAKDYWTLLNALDDRYQDVDKVEEELSWSEMLTDEARKLVAKL